MSQKVHVSSSGGHNGPLASGSREISSTRSARCIRPASGPLQHVRTCRRPHSHPPQSCKTARAAASRERRREPRAAEAAENAASRPLMDRTGWVRGGDRSAGQPMQRSGWIRAARCIAESSKAKTLSPRGLGLLVSCCRPRRPARMSKRGSGSPRGPAFEPPHAFGRVVPPRAALPGRGAP